MVETEADKTFLLAIRKGQPVWKAAFKAYPMMVDPIEHANDIFDTNLLIQTRLNNTFEKNGMTDERVVKKFIALLDEAKDDPTVAKVELSVIKEIAKLKRLYSSEAPPKKQQTHQQDDIIHTQSSLIRMFLKNAKAQLPEEELEKKIRGPIIDVPLLQDSEVFED